MMKRTTATIAALATLSACATSSGVMELADGSFTVSAFAAPARGGASGARKYAFEQAQDHCKNDGGKRAVLVEAPEDKVLLGQFSSASGSAYATPTYGKAQTSGNSMTMAAGTSNLTFVCK